MITLQKKEQVHIYQAVLTIKEKTVQSPFIAVLILAKELLDKDELLIDSETLQDVLLPTLPIIACENLLERLTSMGYFEEIWDDNDGFDGYKLTDLGEQSAIDQSFWVGEKGVYNIYISNSTLLNQQIIKIERVEKGEDDRNGNRIIRIPSSVSQYHNQILNLNQNIIRIEEIENKCFQLNPIECILEIQATSDTAILKIVKTNQILYQTSIETNEATLRETLLINTEEINYNANKKAILCEFNSDNLSFIRKIKLNNPYFLGNQFYSVEIENVSIIPSDKRNAELWLSEILFKGINSYFIEDVSFQEFVSERAKPILMHYNIELPSRSKLTQSLRGKTNAFYQIAKLETIDYLKY